MTADDALAKTSHHTAAHSNPQQSKIIRGGACLKEAEQNPWRAAAARIAAVRDAPARAPRAVQATPRKTRVDARRARPRETKKPPEQGGFSCVLVCITGYTATNPGLSRYPPTSSRHTVDRSPH